LYATPMRRFAEALRCRLLHKIDSLLFLDHLAFWQLRFGLALPFIEIYM
jgi:hypothetical protein